MNCALSTRSTSALRAPTRPARSGRKTVAPRALSDVNVVIGGGKEEEEEDSQSRFSLSLPLLLEEGLRRRRQALSASAIRPDCLSRPRRVERGEELVGLMLLSARTRGLGDASFFELKEREKAEKLDPLFFPRRSSSFV